MGKYLIFVLFFFSSMAFSECDPNYDDCEEEVPQSNLPAIDASQFTPENKNAFVFKTVDKKLQKYPYRNFCKEIKFRKYCNDISLPYDKYSGMKGVFLSDQPVSKSGRSEIKEVLFENGEKYYFSYFKKFGAYSRSSPFVQLSKFRAFTESAGKPFYGGLTIASTGTQEGDSTVILSNGAELRAEYIKPIESILKKFKFNEDIDRLTKLFQKKSIKVDDFTGIIRVSDFGYNKRDHILTSDVVIESGNPKLVFEIKYKGKDWLFVNSYSIKYGDLIYKSGSKKFKRDNAAGSVWEWVRNVANEKELGMLAKLSESSASKIRFTGSTYYSDKNISEKEKNNLKTMLEIYTTLTENPQK